ncbi:hypothetical protein PoB_002645100 [Plakobranchus ocellatus]|uniref:Uncharacterized protein n=1 Tax=Plakobranchus ocellatus TaxID=259542 RepID=A0AAV3ZVH6_9GAST|nr:hypothetical protein PoB_002645100 [Plakobranchus ocellatus]
MFHNGWSVVATRFVWREISLDRTGRKHKRAGRRDGIRRRGELSKEERDRGITKRSVHDSGQKLTNSIYLFLSHWSNADRTLALKVKGQARSFCHCESTILTGSVAYSRTCTDGCGMANFMLWFSGSTKLIEHDGENWRNRWGMNGLLLLLLLLLLPC